MLLIYSSCPTLFLIATISIRLGPYHLWLLLLLYAGGFLLGEGKLLGQRQEASALMPTLVMRPFWLRFAFDLGQQVHQPMP